MNEDIAEITLIISIILLLLNAGCQRAPEHIITTNNFDSLDLGSYVESDLPFIATSLDLRSISGSFSKDSLVSRGI